MSTLTLLPLEPKSPSDLLAAMVLSPAVSPGAPSHIPLLSLSPPTPHTCKFLHGPSSNSTAAKATQSEVDSATFTFTSERSPPHRPLTPNEAHQLSLLITQYLSPVRANPKGLMRESIVLAEDLHQAGIRWDRKRRVMGTHLRGIWDEGQRYGGRAQSGQSRMEIFVQGNFVSVTEQPHPLDPLPLPITVKPELLSPLPKPSLSGALAASTPCVPVSHHSRSRSPSLKTTVSTDAIVGTSPIPSSKSLPQVPEQSTARKIGWRGRKNAGLKIRVDPYRRPNILAKNTQHSLSSRRHTFASMLPWKTIKAFAPSTLTKSIHDTKVGRRVSFGGYEVGR